MPWGTGCSRWCRVSPRVPAVPWGPWRSQDGSTDPPAPGHGAVGRVEKRDLKKTLFNSSASQTSSCVVEIPWLMWQGVMAQQDRVLVCTGAEALAWAGGIPRSPQPLSRSPQPLTRSPQALTRSSQPLTRSFLQLTVRNGNESSSCGGAAPFLRAVADL